MRLPTGSNTYTYTTAGKHIHTLTLQVHTEVNIVQYTELQLSVMCQCNPAININTNEKDLHVNWLILLHYLYSQYKLQEQICVKLVIFRICCQNELHFRWGWVKAPYKTKWGNILQKQHNICLRQSARQNHLRCVHPWTAGSPQSELW